MPKRHKLLVLIMTEALMAAIGAMLETAARVMVSTSSVQAHPTKSPCHTPIARSSWKCVNVAHGNEPPASRR
ncbi:hypothetical protein JJ691_64620 [Kutzneria sp. CA-103260]|nr:hypothetical protein JJ691_64620 [Kutzneria sp. CA-103260]